MATVQILGQKNSGDTGKYIGPNLAFVFPNSIQPDGADPVMRKAVVTTRDQLSYDFVVYENTIDDLATASLFYAKTETYYEDEVGIASYEETAFDLNVELTAGNYYWVGFKNTSGGSLYAGREPGGTNFHTIDSFTDGSNPFPQTCGPTSSYSTGDFNMHIEIVDRDEKLITTIGSSPDSSEYSLLKSNTQYQAPGVRIRYDSVSNDLNDVTVFDDGLFLIHGESDISDSFSFQLAAINGNFEGVETAQIFDSCKSDLDP